MFLISESSWEQYKFKKCLTLNRVLVEVEFCRREVAKLAGGREQRWWTSGGSWQCSWGHSCLCQEQGAKWVFLLHQVRSFCLSWCGLWICKSSKSNLDQCSLSGGRKSDGKVRVFFRGGSQWVSDDQYTHCVLEIGNISSTRVFISWVFYWCWFLLNQELGTSGPEKCSQAKYL